MRSIFGVLILAVMATSVSAFDTLEITLSGKTFRPSQGIVKDGDTIRICNADIVFHKPFSYSKHNKFGPGGKVLKREECMELAARNPTRQNIPFHIFDELHAHEKLLLTVLPGGETETAGGIDLSGNWAGNLTDSSDCQSRWDMVLRRAGAAEWQGTIVISQINCAVTQAGKKVSDPSPVKITSLGNGKLQFGYIGYNYDATYAANQIVWQNISFAKK